MRNGIVIGLALVAILSVYAISRQSKEDRPCRKLNQACKAAGYKRGNTAAERKLFFEQCLKPLMETGTVGDISIDPEDAYACKHKWGKRNRAVKPDDQPQQPVGNDDADDA